MLSTSSSSGLETSDDPGGIFGVSSTVNVLVNGHQVFAATRFTEVNYSGLATIQHDDYGNVLEDKNRLD